MEVVTVGDRPDLEQEAGAAFRERWPEFIFHDELPPQYMPRVDEYFAAFAIYLLDGRRVAAGGWGVPLLWDGAPDGLPEGYRTALAVSVEEDHEVGRKPNAFSFMAAAVAREYDQQGLATQVLNALIDRATTAGLSAVVAPIRPTWKHRYPNVSMADYATWAREDGLSIDPWIRTHQRIGGTDPQARAELGRGVGDRVGMGGVGRRCRSPRAARSSCQRR